MVVNATLGVVLEDLVAAMWCCLLRWQALLLTAPAEASVVRGTVWGTDLAALAEASLYVPRLDLAWRTSARHSQQTQVVGILHANNYRDIDVDRRAGSMAGVLAGCPMLS